MKDLLLKAAMATHIPERFSGLWRVRRFRLCKDLEVRHPKDRTEIIPEGSYTQLWRSTEATRHIYGELVMQDTPQELNTHLNFMLRAHGRVLITGLGLGCVARGCLANPRVQEVTIIERDRDVLKLVRPHMHESERLKIVHADALEWTKNPDNTKDRFDCAWHDLWNDPDAKEPHLQLLHSSLFLNCCTHIKTQGAWNFPRFEKRLWGRHLDMT